MKNKLNGIHHMTIKLNTPFELVETGQITTTTRIENYSFESAVQVDTPHTNISLMGNVQVGTKIFLFINIMNSVVLAPNIYGGNSEIRTLFPTPSSTLLKNNYFYKKNLFLTNKIQIVPSFDTLRPL